MIVVAHRVLIGAAILFGALYTGWELRAWRGTGATRDLVAGLAAGVVTAGLLYYFKNLRRFLGGLPPRR
jgi:hypothetical protein